MAHPEYHRGATGYTPESGDDRVQMTDAGTRQAEDLFGVDQTPGIVAVERSGDRGIRLYYRTRDGLRDETVEFRPWLVVDPETAAELPRQMERIELNGSGRLRVRCEAPNWTTWLDVYRSLREAGRTFASFASAADQYLVDSGRGLFRGMPFDSLIRAQVDIETLGLDPAVDDARIVRRKDALGRLHAHMRDRARDVLSPKPLVERDRRVNFAHHRGRPFRETAAPHAIGVFRAIVDGSAPASDAGCLR